MCFRVNHRLKRLFHQTTDNSDANRDPLDLFDFTTQLSAPFPHSLSKKNIVRLSHIMNEENTNGTAANETVEAKSPENAARDTVEITENEG